MHPRRVDKAAGVLDAVFFWIVLAALLGLAELANPERGARTPTSAAERRNDLGWIALYFVYAPVLGSAVATAAWVTWVHSPARPFVVTVPFAVQLGVLFVVAEVAAYWVHRLQHIVPWLWRIHSIHHSTESLRWWSAFRFHPIDTAISHGLPVIAAAACGAGARVLAPYIAVVTVVTVFAHADVCNPGHALSQVIVTPAYHRTHHQSDRELTNFALVLPLLDRVFRSASFTFGARTFGSDSETPRRGVVAQLAWGFGIGWCVRSGRAGQPRTTAPITSEVMLAHPLVASATSSGTRRRDSIAASARATAISTTPSAIAPPAGRFTTG